MNQPDIEEGATARLCAAMHEALRSAPAVSRGDAFPRAWWQHLGAQAMLGVGFDPDGGEQQGSRRETLTPWRAFVEMSRLYKLAPNHPYFQRFNLHHQDMPNAVVGSPTVSGACFAVRAVDYWSIDGMDERYFLHVEDIDFCLRFARSGGAVLFDPFVVVIHHKSSSRAASWRIEYRKAKSLNLYFRTHFSHAYPRPVLEFVALLVWAAFAARVTLGAIRSAGRSLGRGVRDVQGARSALSVGAFPVRRASARKRKSVRVPPGLVAATLCPDARTVSNPSSSAPADGVRETNKTRAPASGA